MKKTLLLLSLFLAGIPSVFAGSFVYPIDQIAKPACRYSPWNTLDSGCKMALPKISGADYAKYKNDKEYRRIYSVLWGATYTYGWDVGYGSHLGIDISTAQGTPVQSIGDGEVVSSGWQAGWGNTVSIKHTLSDGKAIYSNYAHLSKTSVTKGTVV